MKILATILILAADLCLGQTTFDKKYKVTIVPMDSFEIMTTYMDKSKRDSIARKYSNWHQRSRVLETYLLNIDNPGISRDTDDNIEIKLLNGTKLKLIPDRSKEETDFMFEHYFKDQGLLVFRVQWYEGDNYAIIDITNGRKTYMLGQPYFSSDKKLLVSINCDLEAQYSDNGFELFEFTNREIKKVWEFNPTWWGPVDIMWLDNLTIASKNQHFDTLSDKTTVDYKKIVIKRNAP